MSALFDGIGDARVVTACASALLYLALSAYWLRSVWQRRRNDVAAPGTTLIAYASQTGFAQQLATQTAQSLRSAGKTVRVASLGELNSTDLATTGQALFIVSTTGEGDAPDPAASFVRKTLADSTQLPALRYGLLALGDREYDNFCAFGHQLDSWLRHRGAQSMFDVVEVDNGDEGSLRHWQHHLGLMFDTPDLPDWESPAYERWQLIERKLLNPGSAGDPCFHLVLRPLDPQALQWSAGDIAEVDPFNSQRKPVGDHHPHREYSIASIPEDGALHLLVRQMHREGGEFGLGSGWLTHHASLQDEIALRVRANPNFHLPVTDAPLILIGNGTGIAGLRALLRARIAQSRRRNWLVFGERNAARDLFFGDEIKRWQKDGSLARLDLVFSRDQVQRRYVQHRLAECSLELREWIADGAYIYVCGSLEGMAPGVDAALRAVFGEDVVDDLNSAGRYRRDVY